MADLINVPDLDIKRFRGDSSALTIPLYNPDTGAAFSPVGYTLLFTIKASQDDADIDAAVQKLSTAGGITVANPCIVTLVPADGPALDPGRTYYFDVLAQNATTGQIKHVATGTFWTQQPITRETTLSIESTIVDPSPSYLDAASIAANLVLAQTAATDAQTAQAAAETALAAALLAQAAAEAAAADATARAAAAAAAQGYAETAQSAAEAAQVAAAASAAAAAGSEASVAANAAASAASAAAALASQSAAAASAAAALVSQTASAAAATASGASATASSNSATAAAASAATALAHASGWMWKGTIAAASLPASPTAGDTYLITTAGTIYGKTWGLNDLAIARGASSYDQLASSVWLGLSLPMVAARAIEPFVLSDGATANRAVVHPLPFSMAGQVCVFRIKTNVPANNPSSIAYLFATSSSNSSLLAAYSIRVLIYTDGSLLITQFGSTSGDYRQLSYPGFRSIYSGQTIDLFIRFTVGDSTTPPTIRCNGVDISSSFSLTTAGTPPNWMPSTLVSTYLMTGYNAPAGKFWVYAPVIGTMTDAECDAATTTGFRVDSWYAGPGSPTVQTSGTLTAGRKYRIVSYLGSDSFTNVGAASNATGVEFVATGTTPTTWTSASQLMTLGPIFEPVLQPCRVVDDLRSNGITGYLTSGMQAITPRKDWRIRALVDMSSTGNKQLLSTAVFETPQNHAIDSIEPTHGANGATYSVGDGTTATAYTASAAQTTGRKRLTLTNPFPADSAKTGLYINVTVAGASETAVPIVVRGHRTD